MLGHSRSAWANHMAFGSINASANPWQIPVSGMPALHGQWLHTVTVSHAKQSQMSRARPGGASKGWMKAVVDLRWQTRMSGGWQWSISGPVQPSSKLQHSDNIPQM